MTETTKKWLHRAGHVLTILAIFFVGMRLENYADQLDWVRTLSAWPVLLALTLGMGVANLLLVQVWRCSLVKSDALIGFWLATGIYARSQLAKYVPGNIFHMVGRVTLGISVGIPAAAMTKSLAMELGLFALAGALFLPVLFAPAASVAPFPWLSLCYVAVIAVFIAAIGRFIGAEVKAGLLWALLFLSIMACCWAAVMHAIATSPLSAYWLFVGAIGYVAAWIAGLMTPGAPAGLGVRESTMLFLMQHSEIPQVELLLSILLCRLLCVLGDILFFLASFRMKINIFGNPPALPGD